MSDIPDWAVERALAPFRSHHHTTEWTPSEIQEEVARPKGGSGFAATVLALAKMIAEHEEPPVDPVEVALHDAMLDVFKYGFYAFHHSIAEYAPKLLAELAKRGLEIRPVSS